MDKDLPQYLTPNEVCAILSIKLVTLWRWRRAGKGPPHKLFGRTARFEKSALLAWIEAQPKSQGPTTPGEGAASYPHTGAGQ